MVIAEKHVKGGKLVMSVVMGVLLLVMATSILFGISMALVHAFSITTAMMP